jgi:hypothetical protein
VRVARVRPVGVVKPGDVVHEAPEVGGVVEVEEAVAADLQDAGRLVEDQQGNRGVRVDVEVAPQGDVASRGARPSPPGPQPGEAVVLRPAVVRAEDHRIVGVVAARQRVCRVAQDGPRAGERPAALLQPGHVVQGQGRDGLLGLPPGRDPGVAVRPRRGRSERQGRGRRPDEVPPPHGAPGAPRTGSRTTRRPGSRPCRRSRCSRSG